MLETLAGNLWENKSSGATQLLLNQKLWAGVQQPVLTAILIHHKVKATGLICKQLGIVIRCYPEC